MKIGRGTVQKQLRYLPSKNDIGICFFLPPPYVHRRDAVQYSLWLQKKGLATAAPWVFISTAIVAAAGSAGKWSRRRCRSTCAPASASLPVYPPTASTKAKGTQKRVSFCCCCACCNLIVCHKLLGRPFTEKEENELSRTRRRWRPKEMVLGWECRGPFLLACLALLSKPSGPQQDSLSHSSRALFKREMERLEPSWLDLRSRADIYSTWAFFLFLFFFPLYDPTFLSPSCFWLKCSVHSAIFQHMKLETEM